MIPKIIWQTYETEWEDLPNNFLFTSMTWKNLNPGWEYRYVKGSDREELVKNFDKTLYEIYLSLDGVGRADIWKFLISFKEGGVWADLDSVCTMPLDHYFNEYWDNKEIATTSVGFQTTGDFINSSNYAVTKNNKAMQRVLELIKQYYLSEKELPKIFYLIAWHKALFENEDAISFGFENCMHHSDFFKNNILKDYDVDYFGDMVTYASLAIEHNWKTFIPDIDEITQSKARRDMS